MEVLDFAGVYTILGSSKVGSEGDIFKATPPPPSPKKQNKQTGCTSFSGLHS